MKKSMIVSSVLIGLMAASLPAAAQRTEAQNKAMLKGFEQAFVQQVPTACLNNLCFQTQWEALAYCQGFAEEAVNTQNFPIETHKTLQNTLNTCTNLLKNTSEESACLSPEKQNNAQEQGRKSLLRLLAQSNPYGKGVSYVDGYRQLGQVAADGAQQVAQVYKDGYQNMAEGYKKADYVDGYRQMGQAVANAYKDGYQNMAEGYKKVDYIDGYRQMGQAVANTYKDGYQNMAEGYTKVSYTDGYRQLWQAIKNFIKEGCRAKAKGDLILWQEFQKKHH